MKPKYFDEEKVKRLEDIPNVGKRVANDFRRLGITKPLQLKNKDPFLLYKKLAKIDGVTHDPCLLDVFMSAVSYVNGAPSTPWWFYTPERKRRIKILQLKKVSQRLT